MGHVGHVSDPFNQGDDEGELVVTGLPDDLEGPPAEEAATSGPGEPGGDDDADATDESADAEADAADLDDDDDLDDDQLDQLFDALEEAVIPYLWDGEELFIQAVDELEVDNLIERITNPHAIAAEDGDGGGWLLGELFVSADRLQRDPEEHETVASMLQLATASEEAAPPYGLAEPEWDQLRERVTALATVLEQDDPDPDQVIEAARELRNAVRPYV
jgi:hypothetical protein